MDLIVKYRNLVCEAVGGGNEVDFPAIHGYLVPKHCCTSEKVGHQGQESTGLKIRPGYRAFGGVGRRCGSVTGD